MPSSEPSSPFWLTQAMQRGVRGSSIGLKFGDNLKSFLGDGRWDGVRVFNDGTWIGIYELSLLKSLPMN